MFGAVESVTVTLKLAGVAVFPAASVALQVTVVVPIGNVEPEAWSQPDVARSPSGSAKVTMNGTSAPAGLVAATVMSAGTVITGGEPSSVRAVLLIIAEANGVAPRRADEQTMTTVLTGKRRTAIALSPRAT